MSSDINGEAVPRKGQRNEMRMVARAAEVLRALADAPRGQSLGQIAKATGLPRSTVQRLVGALEVEGFVATEAGQAGVRLGWELIRLGSAVQANIRALLRPHLQDLHVLTKDTVDLTLLSDGTPIVIDQITSTAALRVVSFVGRPLPLHCTASGKAHLMGMTKERARAVLKEPLQSYTGQTKTSVADLLKLAATAHDCDFAYDMQEYEEGVCAIAVPFGTRTSENYAVAISMPVNRFHERLPFLREALRKCQRARDTAAGVI